MTLGEKWDTLILSARSAPRDPITALFGARARGMKFETVQGKEFLKIVNEIWKQAQEEASKECCVPGCQELQ